MGIFKYILKPFVEFNEDQKPVESKPRENTNNQKIETPLKDSGTPSNSSSSIPYTSPSPTVTTASAGNKTYKSHFEELIEEANAKNPLFQGTDFKEFVESKVDVEAIADEGTRYKTAFSVLKRTGLTKERLLTTGHEYIKLIDADLKGFVQAYEQEYQKNVEQKEALVRKKAEELQSLNARIAALNAEMKKMSEEIVDNKSKLNSNKTSFLEAGQAMIKEIQTELQKIDQYF